VGVADARAVAPAAARGQTREAQLNPPNGTVVLGLDNYDRDGRRGPLLAELGYG